MVNYPRRAETRVRSALRDTRVVAITGPRQSGKTTLARRFVDRNRRYLTLDDRATLAAAVSDPVAFVRNLDRVVIDEIQRAPELLLAIKRSVDEDRRAGRFLLTGSANLATIESVKESLAGRIETIPLYPLARSELNRSRTTRFIDKAFAGEACDAVERPAPNEIIDIVTRGGYPEALARKTERRRQDWYRAYVDSIVERDVPDIAKLNKIGQLPRLLQILAHFSGKLTNLSELGRETQLDHKTAEQYVRILEQLFLVRRVEPWSRNELSRALKTPKLHFIDTGLLAAMRAHSRARLAADRHLFAPILESFVFSELLKASAWPDRRVSIYHYRDKDQREVDLVLEDESGHIVGIEVKAAASVTRADFIGLERLATQAGKHFVQGLVLYDGEETLSFADTLRALPLPCLWA
jgi:uncharacterized protein